MLELVEGICVPNHQLELEKAEEYIEDLKFKFRNCERLQKITEKEYIELYQETIRILYYVGDLSQPLFDCQEELEDRYIKMYIHSPELAKKLFFEKCHEVHKPYNLLKNRCYTILDGLDELFYEIHSHAPKEFVEEI